ncbi:MAG: hypothetical protein RLZZ360_325 [Candidatus Parcubacteria bacterium]|jgi:hypothetical protein
MTARLYHQPSPLLLFPVFLLLIIFCIPTTHGQTPTETPDIATPVVSTPNFLLDTPIFTNVEQSAVLLTPTFSDNSTNLAFYLRCPHTLCGNEDLSASPYYQFSAENIGRGSLPFSEYWAPPTATDYAVIEYANDNQQFSCSGLTFEACLADTHFVQVFYFAVVDDSSTITPELRAEKERLNNPNPLSAEADTAAVSEELRLLSINLSSTSISSDLDNGLIVTASLDGIPSVVLASDSTSSTATATDSTPESSSPIKDFFADVVETVVGLFTEPDTPPPPTETVTPPESVPPPVTPSDLEPTTTNDTPSPSFLDTVQSFISTDVTTPDDVTTASF